MQSIGLSCTWRDQGWGIAKGQIYILAVPKDGSKAAPAADRKSSDAAENDAAGSESIGSTDGVERQDATATTQISSNDVSNNAVPSIGEASTYAQSMTTSTPQMKPAIPFASHRLVWESSIAPHEDTKLPFTFSYDPCERYYLWPKAGGGGRHELHLRALEFQLHCTDASNRPFERVLRFLQDQGVWRTQQCTDVVKDTLDSIALEKQSQQTGADPMHVECLRDSGLDVEENPECVGALVQLCASITKEGDIYAMALEESRRILPPLLIFHATHVGSSESLLQVKGRRSVTTKLSCSVSSWKTTETPTQDIFLLA